MRFTPDSREILATNGQRFRSWRNNNQLEKQQMNVVKIPHSKLATRVSILATRSRIRQKSWQLNV